MTVTTISSKLATNGLQQRLHAELSTVEELCIPCDGNSEPWCWADTDCCGGCVCTWNTCVWA